MKKLTMLVAAAFAMTSAMAQLNPMEPIPADKDVRTGKLENGMTYYIRHNEKPKGQADFHILHDVGAIQENDAQQGLAHFLEHMAFNGTKNLPGKQMIEYLEKVGVKFGANLNAGTSWDMTSYMMKDVPTSREGIIDSALLILHDWSHFIALQPEEIDSERGVIMEELRTRDNASWRSTMKMLQALGKGTKYEHRNLIGYLDGLKGFQHKELEDFYNTWYRPDYQAVVIVGDIDVDAVENKLKTLMSDIGILHRGHVSLYHVEHLAVYQVVVLLGYGRALRNDRRNAEFVQTYLDNFQQNRPMPDAKTEWQLDSVMIKALNVEAVNAFAQQAIYPNNQVIVITAPEKEGVENPTTEEILAIRDKVAAAEIEAYEDNTVKEPLIPEGTTLEGSPVKKTAQNAEYGTTEWTLANGVKVIVKPTAYKADEVRMSALAKGGLSILSDEEFYMGEMMPAFNSMSGVGKFSATDLKKQLSGKSASVQPSVENYASAMNGVCSPKDLETMFQLLYLNFTQPRFDENDYNTLHEEMLRDTVGERQVEPRLPDGRQVHRRGIRQQPAPPDGFDRDHRQVQLRGAAGHLQETLSGCQQLRIQVRGQRRPRNAQTAR